MIDDKKEFICLTLTVDVQKPLGSISISKKLPTHVQKKIVPFEMRFIKRSRRLQTIAVGPKSVLKAVMLQQKAFPISLIGIKFRIISTNTPIVQVCFSTILKIMCSVIKICF